MPDFTTASGGEINYSDLLGSDIRLQDLIHQSLGIPRYLAVIDVTLALHSVLVTLLVGQRMSGTGPERKVAMGYAVTHDLHETLVGDCPTKLKRYLPDFRKLEGQAEHAVHEHLGLPLNRKPEPMVSWADKRALQLETMLNEHPLAASYDESVASPSAAEIAAYERAAEIAGDRKAYYHFVSRVIREARISLERINDQESTCGTSTSS